MALPLLRADRTTFFGVFDIDVERRELEQRLSRVDDLLGRALGAALRLRTALRARGIEPLLEFSGHKGYHLWVRFDEAVPAANVRSLLYGLIERAGALPEGIRVEVFPNRDRAAQGTIGPVVKLPLGIHGRTGKRCDLVGEDGKPIADPFAVLGATPFAPSAVARDRQPPAATVTAAPVPTPALGPRAIKIVEGCRVIAHLKDKVEATSYLDHGERTLLLCTLGHLGTEGAEALHALIGRTFNYRKEVTDRHIGKLPSHPISCGRIRERWPNLTAAHPCACPMAPRGGGYPTPLLFALRASQIPAFRARKPAGDMQATVPSAESATGVSTGAPPKPHGANTTVSQAEALLGRIAELRRQERGIASAAARARAELLALFDATGADALDVTAGTLRRTRAADGSWRFLIEI